MNKTLILGLNALVQEFWTDNWQRLNPPGSPKPASNQANFADFSDWLEAKAALSPQPRTRKHKADDAKSENNNGL